MNFTAINEPQLNNLLTGFNDPAASEISLKPGNVYLKPNLKMTIKSNNSSTMTNAKGKTTRVTRCKGKLARNSMGKLKPMIKCNSMKVNSKPEQNKQSDLLRQIFGEVNKEKHLDEFGDEDQSIVNPKPSGCGCGHKKVMPSTTFPLPIHEEEHMPMPDLKNQSNVNKTTEKKKTKRRRRRRRKNTHKVVEVNLQGNKPSIPEVTIKAVKRKKSRSKKKAKNVAKQ
jgi:hypothetical protein